MDDVYLYTNEAVQSSRGSQKPDEQEDVLLSAFNNFGFSQRWTSLVDAVKKQGEQAVNVTRHDLQEFAQVLRDDTTETVEKISKNVKPDVKGKSRATGSNAKDGAESGDNDQEEEDSMIWSYVRQAQQLPSALRLPDNIDLGKLREEMDQGTRFAEQYLQKFGAEVTQIVNKAINVIDDDEYAKQAQEPEGRKSTSSNPSKRIFATRKERLLAEMRTDPDTFLTQVPGPVIDDVEKKTDEIALILEESPELRDMMDRLVPIEVSYVLFWQRYFHHAQKIEKEDEKRQIIAEGAQEELEFKWDSDDEDEATSTQQKKGQKIADEKKNDVDDKKIAASPVPTADKQAAADQSTKTEETKRTTASEDSDSDWE